MAKKYKPKIKPEKVNKNIAAVIDIGSNAIRLNIAQKVPEKDPAAQASISVMTTSDNINTLPKSDMLKGATAERGIEVLEELRYPLSLGADTFSTGKIQLETINKLCQVLLNFLEIIDGYGITNVRAIATTALREAANNDYIIDIIKTETGLVVDILNEVDEKNYIYKEVSKLFKSHSVKIENCLMAYIGIGNLGVSYYEDGMFPFMHSLKLGSLRLTELFENVLDYSENYYQVIDEYQYGVIDDLKILMPARKQENFVVCGSEVLFLAYMCQGEQHRDFIYISKERFISQFEKIKGKTYDQLMEDYDIAKNKAELLFPFMSICKTLLSLTTADKIITPLVYLRDAVLYELLFSKEAKEYGEAFDENIITGALNIAERYGVDMNHANVVTEFSLKIFHKLKTRCGFSKRDGLMLQAASIMHDIGKYINLKNHDDHAYTIINGSDISGLNPEDKEFIACITKFNGKIPSVKSIEYQRLPIKKRVLVSKLSSILGLAETLDRSHTQKFNDMDIVLKDNVLTLTVNTYKDILLEEWAFKKRVDSFEQIFGIKAVLKRRKAMA